MKKILIGIISIYLLLVFWNMFALKSMMGFNLRLPINQEDKCSVKLFSASGPNFEEDEFTNNYVTPFKLQHYLTISLKEEILDKPECLTRFLKITKKLENKVIIKIIDKDGKNTFYIQKKAD